MTRHDRYQFVYDAFGRLVNLKYVSGAALATYCYNGLSFRTFEQPDGGNKTFFCYDERWQIVANFQATNATPMRRDVHHVAGLAGYASSFYIDSVIIEDANLSGYAALEARRYLLQILRTLPVSKSCR